MVRAAGSEPPPETFSSLKRTLLALKLLESNRAKVIEEEDTGLQYVNMALPLLLKGQRLRMTL